MHVVSSVLAVALLICAHDAALAQSGAAYTVRQRIDTIVVDGNLNEASWHGAAATLLTLWNGSPAPAALLTTAKMVWDEEYLYIAFTAADSDIYATYTNRDARLWEQDNYEVFVTIPGTTGYVEVEGSPIGTIWDGSFTNVFRGPGASYTITGLRLAARVHGTLNNSLDQDTGFTAEIALPFADVYQGMPGGHPANGAQLRLNLYRINWNTPGTVGGPGAAGSDTYYAWSPVPGAAPSFHQPDKFGTVTFSTNFVAAPVWAFDNSKIFGTNLVLSGVGHPGGNYRIIASTNLVLPVANWVGIATNSFDGATGAFRFTNGLGNRQLFYRLQSL